MLLKVQLLPSFFSVNCIENGGGSSGLKTEWRWGLRDGMMMPENGGEEIPQRNAKKHLRVYKTYQVFWRNLRWNFTKWYGRAVAKVFSWLLGWGWAGGGGESSWDLICNSFSLFCHCILSRTSEHPVVLLWIIIFSCQKRAIGSLISLSLLVSNYWINVSYHGEEQLHETKRNWCTVFMYFKYDSLISSFNLSSHCSHFAWGDCS